MKCQRKNAGGNYDITGWLYLPDRLHEEAKNKEWKLTEFIQISFPAIAGVDIT